MWIAGRLAALASVCLVRLVLRCRGRGALRCLLPDYCLFKSLVLLLSIAEAVPSMRAAAP
ncbi:hypothetical protein PSP6_300016 [Paraburkholderia tropica]|nr:hypothetical protein PSP6_300016 [Paraburkholderia tropica]